MDSELEVACPSEHKEMRYRNRRRSEGHVSRSILVLTNERDFAADIVVNHLLAAAVDVRRLNIETARRTSIGAWSPHAEVEKPDSPTVVWWRQFELDQHPIGTAEIDDVLVARAQWRTWLSTMHVPNAVWVNDLWSARRAENKIEQLRTALTAGFTVPRTLLTNDPVAALAFRETIGAAVVKASASAYFEFSDQSFVFTEELDDSVLDRRELWFDVPVSVQESLTDCLDARVISFGEFTFGAKCRTKGSDWRKTPFETVLWQQWKVPDAVRRACLVYRTLMGLEYAAFDFMLRADEVYFLEANQAGEWLFIDRAIDAGISAAFAQRLARLASDE